MRTRLRGTSNGIMAAPRNADLEKDSDAFLGELCVQWGSAID